MNDVINAIKNRRSVRKYKPDMLPRDIIAEVVDAGLYAASGMGKQETKIIVVTNKETRDKFAELNRKIGGWNEGFDPFYGAPVVLIVIGNKSAVTHIYDGSLVIGNMMIAAHSLGLGSCWIHRAKEEFESPEGQDLLKSLGIDGDFEGIGHCILGYPDGNISKAAKRKDNRVFFVE